MDLSTTLSPTSNQISSDSEAKNEESIIVPVSSKHAKFLSTYQRQDFSLPDSIMFYITKNPTSAKVYQKMIQTCKYFFVKNPILVVSDFIYSTDDSWFSNFGKSSFDITNLATKFWITMELEVICENFTTEKAINQNFPVSSLIPTLYLCDAKRLVLKNLVISFADLLLLISSAEDIGLDFVTVKNQNGSNIPVEKLVEIAVKAEYIYMQ